MAQADLVLRNGKICTVDPQFRFAKAVAVKDGRIVAVGSDADVQEWVGSHTRVMDLKGQLVLPGIHDSHTHAAHGGLYYSPGFVDTYGVSTYQEFRRRLEDAARNTPPGEWIISGGMSRCLSDLPGPLTRRELDDPVPDHPLMVNNSGLHGLLLNSRAMELCGIRADTPDLDPALGEIERDAAGQPTGFLREFAAQSLAMRHIRLLTDRQMEDSILRIQGMLNRYGVTTHTDIAGPGGDNLFCGTWGMGAIEAYERLARAGRLTARCAINVFAGLDGVQSYDAIIGGLDRLRLPEFSDPTLVNAKAVKIFGDASWRRPEDARSENHLGHATFPGGTAEEQVDNMTRTLVEVHRRGWQMGIHLTGGRGIDAAVAALAEAQRRFPKESPRHFIIHADEISSQNIRDCVRHHIMISTQSIAPYCFLEELVGCLKPGLGESLFNYREWLDAGIVVSQGSDAPTMSHNWLLGLQFALTRTTRQCNVFHPELACTLPEAIRMYTINGAYQNHMDGVCGSIEVGKLADFAVLDRDLFAIPPEQVGKAQVVMTILGGKVVYEA